MAVAESAVSKILNHGSVLIVLASKSNREICLAPRYQSPAMGPRKVSKLLSDSLPHPAYAYDTNISTSEKRLSDLKNSCTSELKPRLRNAVVDLNILATVFSEGVKCLQCGGTVLRLLSC
ncbi:hypothetical protein TNIN_84901 [Trichonephila inaurata madagascariensis]|uniref:Uncharacterized protein n=1 Tax=Trichonephila inaurata madagascariensis TaxID=2747483 RepID=A0A8X6K270_9ARAC|nr:hypothetical protein TNIN_84901 [Trichonephila inaurata madagascariensis]